MTGRDEFSELISAYLDGEVTPEEKTRIEERLVDDADDRRLFEQMRSIRNRLQALPRRELGKDLSESVLRRAERAMLAADSFAAGDGPDEASPEPEDSGRRDAAIVAHAPMPADHGGWRALAWCGATIAAVLLIMFLGPWSDRGPRDVARQTPAVKSPASAGQRAEDGREAADFAHSVAGENAADGVTADVAEIANRAERAKQGLAETRRSGVGEMRKPESGPALGPQPAQTKVGAPAPGAVAGQSATKAGPGYREMPGADKSPARSLATAPAAPSLPAAKTLSPLKRRYADRIVEDLARLEIPADQWLVVNLDMPQTVASVRSFDEALARNDIHYGGETDARPLARVRKAYSARDKHGAKNLDDAADGAVADRKAKQDQLAAVGDGRVELVYVEAPADQVRAVLEDLAHQPENFQIVGLDPGPTANKRQAPLPVEAPRTELAAPARQAELLEAAADAISGVLSGERQEAVQEESVEVQAAEEKMVETAPADLPAEAATAPPAATAPIDEPEEGSGADLALKKEVGRPVDRPGAAPVTGEGPGPNVASREEDLDGAQPAESPLEKPASMAPAAPQPQEPSTDLKQARSEPAGPGTTQPADRLRADNEKSADAGQPAADEASAADEPSAADDTGESALPEPRGGRSDPHGAVRRGNTAHRDAAFGASRGFAQRLSMPPAEAEEEKTDSKSRPDADAMDDLAAEFEGASSNAPGGFGGGGPAAPAVRADGDDGGGGGGDAFSGGRPRRSQSGAAGSTAASPRMVRVLFVLRTVEPMAGVAADVAADGPPAASVRLREEQVEAGAESIEAEAVMDAAEPPVRE